MCFLNEDRQLISSVQRMSYTYPMPRLVPQNSYDLVSPGFHVHFSRPTSSCIPATIDVNIGQTEESKAKNNRLLTMTTFFCYEELVASDSRCAKPTFFRCPEVPFELGGTSIFLQCMQLLVVGTGALTSPTRVTTGSQETSQYTRISFFGWGLNSQQHKLNGQDKWPGCIP